MSMKEYILATRPWSFTAAAVPILVAAAAVRAPLLTVEFARAMCLGIAVQAGANLTNTYFDFKNGVDNKDAVKAGAGEGTLVDKKLTPQTVMVLSVVCYAIGFAVALPTIAAQASQTTLAVVVIGIALSFFYTATPVGLKYKALGDITIFVCFGPLLMQCTALMLTGAFDNSLWLYCIPTALLTEAILHANNSRDIEADAAAGATTLATLIGFEASFLVFCFLFLGAYMSAVYIALLRNWGVIVSLITVPLAGGICARFHKETMRELPEEVAKMHLPFGVLVFLGIVFTESGFLAMGKP